MPLVPSPSAPLPAHGHPNFKISKLRILESNAGNKRDENPPEPVICANSIFPVESSLRGADGVDVRRVRGMMGFSCLEVGIGISHCCNKMCSAVRFVVYSLRINLIFGLL